MYSSIVRTYRAGHLRRKRHTSVRHKIDNTTRLAHQMIWKIRTSAQKDNEKEHVEYIVKSMKKLRKFLKILQILM